MRRWTVSPALILTTLLGAALLAQQPAPPQPAAQAPASPIASALRVAVIDAAHGGTDAGARAEGIQEKELTLQFTRMLRAEFLRRGLRVVLTREGDEAPSFDERAAAANTQRGAIFITVHVGAGGEPGTARAYFFRGFPAPAAGEAARRPHDPLPWDRAQEPHLDLSRRLADLVQLQFSRRFRGSPEIAAPAAVRQLRSITAPAVAIEISHLGMERRALEQMVPRVAEAVGLGVAAFRPVYDAAGAQ